MSLEVINNNTVVIVTSDGTRTGYVIDTLDHGDTVSLRSILVDGMKGTEDWMDTNTKRSFQKLVDITHATHEELTKKLSQFVSDWWRQASGFANNKQQAAGITATLDEILK